MSVRWRDVTEGLLTPVIVRSTCMFIPQTNHTTALSEVVTRATLTHHLSENTRRFTPVKARLVMTVMMEALLHQAPLFNTLLHLQDPVWLE